MPSNESELIAQQVSGLNQKLANLEKRIADTEKVNARLEQAALITARALQEISGHWDAVYEAMRRAETDTPTMSERDNAAARERRSSPTD